MYFLQVNTYYTVEGFGKETLWVRKASGMKLCKKIIWKENGLKHLRDAATPFEYDETLILFMTRAKVHMASKRAMRYEKMTSLCSLTQVTMMNLKTSFHKINLHKTSQHSL